MSLKEKIKQLPQSPGVYMMLDSLGNIIYVGKAKILRNRVSQYFHKQKDRAPKVTEMIQNTDNFQYLVTDTELDALVEECRLIKELKPLSNRQLKNYQRYCYLKIANEAYPKLTIVREKSNDQALYFGPFTSPHRVEMAVQYLKDFYPIRKCTTPGLVKSTNGCLFRQLGTCLGVCTGQVTLDEYSKHIEGISQLLNGSDLEPVQELLKKQEVAIKNLDFEKAARYSEYYLGLRHLIAKQQLVRSSNKERNILVVEAIKQDYLKFFFIKGNKLLFHQKYDIKTIHHDTLKQELILRIKENFLDKKESVCNLTQSDIDEAQIITSYLKRNKDRINSFWIPSTKLKKDDNLGDIVDKVIHRILICMSLQKLQ